MTVSTKRLPGAAIPIALAAIVADAGASPALAQHKTFTLDDFEMIE
jgi:hypothetical protein